MLEAPRRHGKQNPWAVAGGLGVPQTGWILSGLLLILPETFHSDRHFAPDFGAVSLQFQIFAQKSCRLAFRFQRAVKAILSLINECENRSTSDEGGDP
jgi:hypothetical protein